MNKLLVAFALAFVATTASATIAGGSHDLSTRAGAQISSCQFCHAPHFGTATPAAGAPLWNRANPAAGTFTPYDSLTLSAVAKGVGSGLGVNSLTCLSCHDGVGDMGATVVGSRGFAATTPMTGYALVGTALTNDHPVGIVYNTADTTLVAAMATQAPTATQVGTYGGKVECGSCHDPHGTSNGVTGGASFLRDAATTICARCHSK